jgi:hypothetical protein
VSGHRSPERGRAASPEEGGRDRVHGSDLPVPRLWRGDPGHSPRRTARSGYGPQLQSKAVLGKIEERLPYRKLHERLAREGAPIITAAIQGLVWAAGERLEEEYGAILERIPAAPAVHADETSYRVGGHRWWLWTFTTATDTLLVLRPSRGEGVVWEILGRCSRGR